MGSLIVVRFRRMKAERIRDRNAQFEISEREIIVQIKIIVSQRLIAIPVSAGNLIAEPIIIAHTDTDLKKIEWIIGSRAKDETVTIRNTPVRRDQRRCTR